MTTETADAALSIESQARIERLRQRRATTPGAPSSPGGASSTAAVPAGQGPSRTPRRRVATGTKIATAGIGGTVMFGIVAALALADNQAAATPAPPQASPARPIVVVVHPAASPPAQATVTVDPTATSAVTSDIGTQSTSPVELTARPVVTTVEVQRQAPVAAAPEVRTSGSG